jgi:secreted PhoX family phosphatase
LVDDPEGILDLPEGFSYQVLETVGDLMDDGYFVPGRPDGMCCFELASGRLAVMRNHELSPGSWNLGAYTAEAEPPEVFDVGSLGGVTRLVVDPENFNRVSSNLVLTGTNRNCAGGWSPWGWLSCEENLALGHGYVFLCDPEADSLREPNIKKMYGRFNHEAAAIHHETMICYLTEDHSVGSFYRFVPDDPLSPFVGQLQALRVEGLSMFNTGNMLAGDMVEVSWVDIDEPDAGSAVHIEAQAKGAAKFVRGEGLWIDGDDIWICSTSGGPVGRGQIFRLRDGETTSTLELIVQSDDAAVLDMPDNICVSPTGEVFMSEDGGGDQYVRFIDAEGQVRDFARNAKSYSEIAGVCFSPGGNALFMNLQADGITLVVTGPFGEASDGETSDCGGESESGGGGDTGIGTAGDGGGATSADDSSGESEVGDEGGMTQSPEGEGEGGREEGDPMQDSELSVGCACEAGEAGSVGANLVLAAVVAGCRAPRSDDGGG